MLNILLTYSFVFQIFKKKNASDLKKNSDVKKEYFYIVVTSLDTCVVQFKSSGGVFSYIVPITSAITNQESSVPSNIIGCYKIRGKNGNPVTIKQGSSIPHKQIVLSCDDDQFNLKFLLVWKENFLNWVNSDEIQGRFVWKKNFCFGGFVNSVENPGFIGSYLLEGDAIALLKEMYDGVSLAELAEDMTIPRAMFGAGLSREEINKLLVPDVLENGNFDICEE